MMKIAVLPRSALRRAEQFLATAGWRVGDAGAAGDDARAAIALVGRGRAVLLMPAATHDAGRLRRIVVIHEGSRGDRGGMDAADAAAVATGAKVIVLHVPPKHPSRSAASLPFRMADHAVHDWAEWREEFMRRFGSCSEGVDVTLKVGASSVAELRQQIADEGPDLVIASSHGAKPGEGEAIDAVLDAAMPVLLVPSVGQHDKAEPASTSRRT